MSCGTSSIGSSVAVKVALQRDVEALVLRARAVIGEVQGLLDQRVEIDRAALAASTRANAPACS